MVPSAIINEAIVFSTLAALYFLIRRTPREKLMESFRFFTVQSNLFCTLTALILLVCAFFGAMPRWAVALKYMGTVTVMLTMCTVLFYLLPLSRRIHGLLDGPELVMHLTTPVLAIWSFLRFEKGDMSAWLIPLGILPVLLYGWLYLDRVVFAHTWEDMYSFNKGGRWKRSFAFMMAGTVLIALLLWAV